MSGTSSYMYVTGVDYNESGQVTATYLGNGIVNQSCYQANNLRLTKIRAYSGSLVSCGSTPSSPLLNLQYSGYDNVGNVTQVVDSTRSETLNYTYDDLDRLTGVSGAYSQSFAYNTIGNLTSKAGTTLGYAAQSALACADGALTKAHAVTSAGSDSYCYDPNGDMVKRNEGTASYTQAFDAEHQLTSITPTSGTAVSFKYNGDGNLVAKLEGNDTTYYIGGLYEVKTTTTGGSTSISTKTTYYPAGGAMRVEDLVASTNKVYYLLKDQLGSASVTLDNTGASVAELRYYPFGETRVTSGTTPTDRLFTGQKQVTGFGLYNYGARYYDPQIGRFISADTIVPNYTNSQSLNRYSYVLNNPTQFTDPTGHNEDCGIGIGCVAKSVTVIGSNGQKITTTSEVTATAAGTTTRQKSFCDIYVVQCQFESNGGGDNDRGGDRIKSDTKSCDVWPGCFIDPAYRPAAKEVADIASQSSTILDYVSTLLGGFRLLSAIGACTAGAAVGGTAGTLAGPEGATAGGLAGCAAAYDADSAVTAPIALQQVGLGTFSTLFTEVDDLYRGNMGWDVNNGEMVYGGNTVFQAAFWVFGKFDPEPATSEVGSLIGLLNDQKHGFSGWWEIRWHPMELPRFVTK